MTHSHKKGFTLLELLIVITILAILTLVVVLFINPVEILKKSRDVQRMSDLDILRTGINLYLQDNTSNTLSTAAAPCSSTAPASEASGKNIIRTSYSNTTASTTIAFATQVGAAGTSYYTSTSTAELARNDALGWIPGVNFSTVRTGAPISKLPVDPVNTATGVAGYDSLYYRYACKTDNTFELDATLESDTYGVNAGSAASKAATDGGSTSMRYEVGTNLRILPSSAPTL